MHCCSYKFCFLILTLLYHEAKASPIYPTERDWIDNDMRLSSTQLELLEGTAKARNVKLWTEYYWPNSTLVYSIGQGFAPLDITLITQAMSSISTQTCLRFRRTYNNQEPQVIIGRKDSGCWSYVGYQRNQQNLNLGSGCMSLGIIQHEILHALALLHMQSDPNRDKFVRIAYENIEAGMEGNFVAYKSTEVGDFGFGYDYDSIMHYGAYAFSKNGQATIIPLQNNAKIGQRTGLSIKDILKLNRIYC